MKIYLYLICLYLALQNTANAQLYNPLNPASPVQITPGTTSTLPNASRQFTPGTSYGYQSVTTPNVLSPVSPMSQPNVPMPNTQILNPNTGVLNPNINITAPNTNMPNMTQPQSSIINSPPSRTIAPLPQIQLP